MTIICSKVYTGSMYSGNFQRNYVMFENLLILFVIFKAMDSIRQLTDQINVFVRFFESINCLFLQLQWLENNITRSSNGLIITVGCIVLFCLFAMIVGQDTVVSLLKSLGIPETIATMIYNSIPILIIVIIIGLFFMRRFQLRHRRSSESNVITLDDISGSDHHTYSYNPVNSSDVSIGEQMRRRPFDAVAIPIAQVPAEYADNSPRSMGSKTGSVHL